MRLNGEKRGEKNVELHYHHFSTSLFFLLLNPFFAQIKTQTRTPAATPPDELAPLLDALTADALDQMRVADDNDGEEEGQSSSWHRRLGGASLAQAVAAASSTSTADAGGENRRWVSAASGEGGSEALASLVSAACSLLRDAEPRVRHAAAGLLGALAAASSSSSSSGGSEGGAGAAAGGGESVASASSSPSSSDSSFPPVWLLGARDAIFDIVERDWDRDEQGEEGGEEEKGGADRGPAATAATDDDGIGSSGLSSSPPPLVPPSPQPPSLVDAALSAAYARQRPGKGELRHGSEGWRCLEAALVALLSVADGCGASFAAVARRAPEVRALALRSLLHPNRFVREAGYGVLGGLCALAGSVGELDRWGGGAEAGAGAVEAGAEEAEAEAEAAAGGEGGGSAPPPRRRRRSFADAAADALADGLSENWSQVRLAACVAARSLLAAAAADDEANNERGGGKGGGGGKDDEGGGGRTTTTTTTSPETSNPSSSLHSRLLARLLPQLAFNRYDSAEGVRRYSNETWLLHTRGEGRRWVRARADDVFAYYLRCSRANNHMVRESAAVCVGELFSKVGRAGGGERGGEGGAREEQKGGERASSSSSSSSSCRIIGRLVPRALQLLLSAARDDAWPVRDEGGRALAGLLAAFPEEVLLSSSSSAAAARGGGGGGGGGGTGAAAAAKDPSSSSSSCSSSADAVLDSLVSIWRGNLEDNVPSVRDGAAVSMADALEGLLRRAKEEEQGEEEEEEEKAGGKNNNGTIVASAARRLSSEIEETIRERLPRAALQPAGECAGAPSAVPFQIQQAPTAAPGRSYRPFLDSKAAASAAASSSSPAAATAAADAADESDDASLFAPSDLLSRRRDTGGVDFSCGCMDYGFRRPVEPWEQSDGAARLLREWSRVEKDKALALAAEPLLADAALQRHFAAASALRETVWSSLPVIAGNVGIRAFKSRALELFLGPLVDCLEAGGGGGGGARRMSGGSGNGGGSSSGGSGGSGGGSGGGERSREGDDGDGEEGEGEEGPEEGEG